MRYARLAVLLASALVLLLGAGNGDAALQTSAGLGEMPSLPLPQNYTTNTQTGQAIVPGSADIGNHCDDCTSPLTFPFPVSIYGTQYTSAVASSNGNIQFMTSKLFVPLRP